MNTPNKMEQRILNQKLVEAAGDGDTESVVRLIHKGADVHADNEMALIFAACYGHIETLKSLISFGANIHHEDVLNHTAWNGHNDIIKLLYERGVDITTGDNKTLISAISNERNHSVRLLLELNPSQEFINTALIWAARKDNIEILRLIVSTYGCNSNDVLNYSDCGENSKRWQIAHNLHNTLDCQSTNCKIATKAKV